VPETEAIPPEETLGGSVKSGDLSAAGSEEPGLPEAVTRKELGKEMVAPGDEEPGLPEAFTRKDDAEKAAEPKAKPCKGSRFIPLIPFFFHSLCNFKWREKKAERTNQGPLLLLHSPTTSSDLKLIWRAHNDVELLKLLILVGLDADALDLIAFSIFFQLQRRKQRRRLMEAQLRAR
jgi:hypothetical protein